MLPCTVTFSEPEVTLHTATGTAAVPFQVQVCSEPWLDRLLPLAAPIGAATTENVTSRFAIRLCHRPIADRFRGWRHWRATR